MRSILIYGDTNLNARDGSSIWLRSIAQCLSETASDVYLLLKADVTEEDRLADLKQSGVTILTPFDDKKSGGAGLPARFAARRIVALDRRYNFDIILSRGFEIASHLAISGKFSGRLWPYLTEGPAFQFNKTEHEINLLSQIGDQARRVFAQTEEARSVLESNMPTATGKTLLMNPIIPDNAFQTGEKRLGTGAIAGPLSLVYAGKFARLWNTLDMPDLPARLRQHGIESHIHMIGDKFNLTDNDYPWLHAMRAAAASKSTADVTWHGGMPRSEVLELIANSDIGMSWRDGQLDTTPEVSTKMLEYAALGTPPLVNRSALHEQLFGENYPLFIENNDVIEPLINVSSNPSVLVHARELAFRMAEPFSMSSTVQRFKTYFERAEGRSRDQLLESHGSRRKRVLIAGHDFKFAADLIEMLRQRKDIELRIDEWRRLAVHDQAASRKHAEWADIIICEWAGPNAVFYSGLRKPEQKLFIRFHGFEIRGHWLKNIKLENVNGIVFVSDFYRREVLHKTGWPEHKTTVIYNTVDQEDLYRPKDFGSQFQIGLAGYVPMLKRPDRAVDLLRELLEVDSRYYLRIRGREPWNYPWEWSKPIQQDAYRAFYESIASDELLRDRIIFENFGPDMGNWFRKIGWMLSPSSRETFHLAPVEGMTSGAVPVVWEREGATEIFGETFVHQSTKDAASFILENSQKENYAKMRKLSLKHASKYDVMEARSQWMRLINSSPEGPIELNGSSILEGVESPKNQAETIALFYRELRNGGFRAAFSKVQDTLDYLEPTLRNEIRNGAVVDKWVHSPNTVLPEADLNPLYQPVSNLVLAVGDAVPGCDTCEVITAEVPTISGEFYTDALLHADSTVRQARRERPFLITASGSFAACFGALIAARRLGIQFIRGTVLTPPEHPFLTETYNDLYEMFVKESVAQISELEGKSNGRNLAERSLSKVTLGLISDEFTGQALSAEVSTIFLERKDWRSKLNQVDVVIVESAWEGIDGQWFHGVAYHGEEEAADLWALLEACREQGIPTIFWNKEDPIHFRSFAQAAGRCDHIFTTDAGMISKYLAAVDNQASTVSSLSFFAQPKIHNPLPQDHPWKGTVAFAGTYYGDRYPKRSEELKAILGVAANEGLTIYDRQHGRIESPYRFPPPSSANTQRDLCHIRR